MKAVLLYLIADTGTAKAIAFVFLFSVNSD